MTGKKTVLILFLAVCVVAVAAIAVYFARARFVPPPQGHHVSSNPNPPAQTVKKEAPAVQKQPESRAVPQGYAEYRSQPYHFSILYPAGLSVRESGGAQGNPLTVVLANSDASRALQIYVQPYNLPAVTPERFKLDAPYTSTTELTTIMVQGAKGLEFVGTSAGNPDMLEIWFIRQGLLYEVTAPASLKDWAEDVLDTWEFA